MIPVTVITGFLGSGKTTLINGLLQHPGMVETAILVNEFGEVGVDHLLVEHLDEATMLFGAGCLCCSVREDVVAGLTNFLQRRTSGIIPDFRRVILETSGLADPAPLLHTLITDERINRIVSIGSIVTTVDALEGERQLAEESESVRQAAAADLVVLTKTDIAPDTTRLRTRLAALNEDVEILTSPITPDDLHNESREAERLARWLSAPFHTHHDNSITSLSLTTSIPLRAHHIIDWIERIIASHGDRLLRLKGILDLEGCDVPIAVHGVGHVFYPFNRLSSWPDGTRGSRVVLIGRHLATNEIRNEFARICAPAVEKTVSRITTRCC